jgi:hypothetical protein
MRLFTGSKPSAAENSAIAQHLAVKASDPLREDALPTDVFNES